MDVLVIVSANAEWRAVRETLPQVEIQSTPMGEYFDLQLPASQAARFFHGGWGKISAAASAQYVIDHFRPDVLVNLGTCGGFEGRIRRGTIILVERTVVYDLIEQMSDPAGAIAHYASTLDLSWLPEPYPHPVSRGLMVSGDRDILVDDIPMLVEKYGAVAADWESGAIAWVAARNGVRCLILRGVSDLVGDGCGDAYDGHLAVYVEGAAAVMRKLVERLPLWLALAPNT